MRANDCDGKIVWKNIYAEIHYEIGCRLLLAYYSVLIGFKPKPNVSLIESLTLWYFNDVKENFMDVHARLIIAL